MRVYARLQNNVASPGLCFIAVEYSCAARVKSWPSQTQFSISKQAASLLSIPRKALLASALSRTASCLSSSETSLRSVKLSVERAGDGTDEGEVVEDKDDEDCEDSLMVVERAAFQLTRS